MVEMKTKSYGDNDNNIGGDDIWWKGTNPKRQNPRGDNGDNSGGDHSKWKGIKILKVAIVDERWH